MLETTGNNNEDGSFNWKDALVDAGITGGTTFFSSLVGTKLMGANPSQTVTAAGIAAATQFFIFLSIKRGLRKKE